jgi:hypothetical protein
MPQVETQLLRRLREREVEFVIIGGFCGVMHGVTLVTRDLDVCCRFTPANLRRIEAAVKDLHPYHRQTPNRLPFELTDELCGRLTNLYLQTDFGPLDCLGEVKGLGTYEDVVKRSIVFTISYGDFRILDLPALIASKEAMGRERDLQAVRQLRAIQEKIQANPAKGT